MKKSAKRLLSLLLATILVFSGVPVWAVEESPTLGFSGTITGFTALDPIAVAKGTTEGDIPFPATVTATVLPDGEGTEETSTDIAVGKWEIADGTCDPEVEKPYVYQAVRDSLTLPAGIALPEAVEMPVVRVDVGEFTVGITPMAAGDVLTDGQVTRIDAAHVQLTGGVVPTGALYYKSDANATAVCSGDSSWTFYSKTSFMYAQIEIDSTHKYIHVARTDDPSIVESFAIPAVDAGTTPAPANATLDLSSASSATFAGTSGTAEWNADTKTLTLTDFIHSTSAQFAMKVPDGTKILLSGPSSITGGKVGSFGDQIGLEIASGTTGVEFSQVAGKTGSLTIASGSDKSSAYGIYSEAPVTVSSGTVTAVGGTASNGSYGVVYIGTLTVSGTGVLIATAGTASNQYAVKNFGANTTEPSAIAMYTNNSSYDAIAIWDETSKTYTDGAGGSTSNDLKLTSGSGTPADTVTLTVNKDGSAFAGHGKTFALYENGISQYTGTGVDDTVTFSSVADGAYDIYDGTTDTGVDVTVNSAAASATVNYYTVSFDVYDAGDASGSTISAEYDDSSISSGDVVIGGKKLVIDVDGSGAINYTYAWSGTGTNSETTTTLTIDNLAGEIDATCTVTGDNTPPTATITPAQFTFATQKVGYAPVEEQLFTITNTGTVNIRNAGVSLTGHGFKIGTSTLKSTIAPNKSVTVGIKPADNLPKGSYSTDLIVLGSGDLELTATISFTVTDNPLYTLKVVGGRGGGKYTENATVTITAASAPTGKVFDKWTGGNGGTFADANNATTFFTMPANAATVTATYKDSDGPSPIDYTIAVSANPSNGGTVSGNGTFADGSTRTVTATSNKGFLFKNWTENGTEISADASYTFTLTEDRNLVANFIAGNVDVEVKPQGNAPTTTLPDQAAVEEAVLTTQDLTDIQNGSDIAIVLEVKEATPPASDQQAIEDSLQGQTLGMYLDISLFKQKDGGTPEAVTQLSKPIQIRFAVPAELAKSGRTFSVIRVHDGVAEVLHNLSTDPNYILVETDRFSTYALAYADATTPPPEQPPVSKPVGRPSNSSSSSGGSSGSSTTAAVRPAAPSNWLEPAQVQSLAGKSAEGYVRTKSTVTYGVRKDAWSKLMGFQYQHDTVSDKSVQVRLSIPAPEKMVADTYVTGWVKGKTVDSCKALFEKWFTNQVRVIHMDNPDPWGQEVQIAAKVDLANLDSKRLYFYCYNRKTNSYTLIEKPRYWIDENGYLHFYTELAGDIIISEGPLERR